MGKPAVFHLTLITALGIGVFPVPAEAQLWRGCFDPTGAACFQVLTLDYVVEQETDVNYRIRTDSRVRLFGPMLPALGPLDSWFLELLFSQPRIDGISDYGQTPVGDRDNTGALSRTQVLKTTGVKDYRKGSFDFPFTVDDTRLFSVHVGYVLQGGSDSGSLQCNPSDLDIGVQKRCYPWPVPEPAGLLLLSAALLGLAWVARERRRSVAA